MMYEVMYEVMYEMKYEVMCEDSKVCAQDGQAFLQLEHVPIFCYNQAQEVKESGRCIV